MLKELESTWVWMVSSMTQEGLFCSKNKLFTWKNHLEFRRSSIYSGGENSTGLHSLGFWCHRYENKAGFQHRGGPYDPGRLSNYAPTEKARIIQADSDSGYKSCSMEGSSLLKGRVSESEWFQMKSERHSIFSSPQLVMGWNYTLVSQLGEEGNNTAIESTLCFAHTLAFIICLVFLLVHSIWSLVINASAN